MRVRREFLVRVDLADLLTATRQINSVNKERLS